MAKSVLHTIEDNLSTFSKGQKRIGRYILDHYDQAAFMTASKLGKLTEVSESTVVRFAAELGFDGYPAMQKALQEMARNRLTSTQRIQAAENIYDRDVLSSVLQADIENLRQISMDEDRDTFHLAPGAEAFLDSLKAAGIPMTIATSSDLENLDFYFAHFPLARWFEKPLCVYEDGSFESKPAPDIYQRAAGRLQTAPADCVVFEDALSGIRAAHSAGIGQIVAVASSAQPAFFADTPGVSRVVRDYTALSIQTL